MSQKIESIYPTSTSKIEKNVDPVGEEKHGGVNNAFFVPSTVFNYEGVQEVLDTQGMIFKRKFRGNEVTTEGAENTSTKQSSTNQSNSFEDRQ